MLVSTFGFRRGFQNNDVTPTSVKKTQPRHPSLLKHTVRCVRSADDEGTLLCLEKKDWGGEHMVEPEKR